MSGDLFKQRHMCGIPGCNRRIIVHYFACGQHRALLGYELSVRMNTAWLGRSWNRSKYLALRREAIAFLNQNPATQCAPTPSV